MIEARPGTGADGNEPGWCDRYLATIAKRKKAVQTALARHWERGGQVLEYSWKGRVADRTPYVSPDSLRTPDSLAELLACRCQGFTGFYIELVNMGPFPTEGD